MERFDWAWSSCNYVQASAYDDEPEISMVRCSVARGKPESKVGQRETVGTLSIRERCARVVASFWLEPSIVKRVWPEENLCLAGRVALNCVENTGEWILREGAPKGLWIQPAAGVREGKLSAGLNRVASV